MSERIRPDLCVIGGGAAGRAVAVAASAVGASVVLVENGEMGANSLGAGRVPLASFIAASHHAEIGRQGAGFGVAFEPPRINFGRIHEHIADVSTALAPNDSIERFEGLGIEIIRGGGCFVDKRTFEADGGAIRARRFVIATGSRPAVPPIPGIDGIPFLTEKTALNLTRKPVHPVIIGAGPTGLELAQAYRRLGCEVSVIEMGSPLAEHDPELAEIAVRRIVADGVALHANTPISNIAPHGNGVAVTITTADGEDTVTGSHLVLAAGRMPVVENLGLDAAGIRFDKKGIEVDTALRTSNRRVYAVGDVAGASPFAPIADYHAGLVVRSALFGLPARENRSIVPITIHIDPEIATVGLDENEALKRYPDKAKVLRWPFAENAGARIARRTDGFIKLITDKNGRLLGCAIVGPGAGEMIAFYAYAIANGDTIDGFLKYVAPYPSLSEMAAQIAREHHRDASASFWMRHWLSFVRLFP
jgi:pyruvate/2-oxoglutarate dehydrogenase complex dihydrolipoamide dehydrogenase (E3) component